MPFFWFLTGVLSTLAAVVVLLPRLRTARLLEFLAARPWPASLGAIAILAAALGLFRGYGPLDRAPRMDRPASEQGANGFKQAAQAFDNAAGGETEPGRTDAPKKAAADSMDTAIAKLQARLAQGGGTDGDWELLAKSFEFLARPDDALKARAHRLPVSAQEANANAAESVVSGEIALAPALSSKVTPGETLFVVARSVDAPGMPVAVLKTSVSTWPLKFKLDDSLSMLPGRNLSSAGVVTVVAHISPKGQPLPASGDLQGVTGAIDPSDRRPLKILIDQIIK